MKKIKLFVCFLLMMCFCSSKAQTLNVNDAVSPSNLIANLITSNCDTVTNIAVVNDGSGQSINSYGSFTGANNPSFSLTEGMVLTTGKAVNAGTAGALNNIGEITNWAGSTLYENTLGLNTGTTFNATDVEFTFTALKDNVVIDYVFASEEYVLNSLCTRNEGVIILVKESGTSDNTYVNIATIPGTSMPITVANVHAGRSGQCIAVNENYLGGARGFSSPFPNYSQYTATLQAQTNSVMGVEYTIRIIVADEEDGNYDSAVFVAPIDNVQETPVSATFISDGTSVIIDNGSINECGQGVVLKLDLDYPSTYTYEWLNGTSIISGENTTSLPVTTTGTYTIRVYQSSSCFSEETIVANLSANQIGNSLSNISECVASGTAAIFDLSSQDVDAIADRTSGVVVYYTGAGAALTSVQANAYLGTNAEIISAVITEASGCMYTSTFTLIVDVDGSFLDPLGYDLPPLCDSADPVFNDGFTAIYPSDIEPHLPVLTSGSYIYYDHNNNIITDGGVGTFTTGTNGYTPFRIEYNSDSGCTSSAELRITVNQPPSVTPGTITYIEVCDNGIDGDNQDGFATFDMTPKRDELQAELTAVSSLATIEFYPSLLLAETGLASDVILDITTYRNDQAYTLNNIQLVGIRIESQSPNECYATQELQLRPRYLITNSDFQDELICDSDGDGFETFDLSNKKSDISASNNYLVSIFRSFADAEMNSNEITDAELINFTNEIINTQRLWVRIEDLDIENLGCVDYDEELAVFNLNVESKPVITQPMTTLLTVCDPGTDGQVDGLVSYFNAQLASEITTDNTVILSYFDFLPDPITTDPTTAIDNVYTNVVSSSPLSYWVMGANAATGCFSDPVSFQLQVNPAPVIDNSNPNIIYFCYDSTDTNPIIPIDENNTNIIINQTGFDIAYYTSETGALEADSAAEIDLVTGFFVDNNTSIWYRISNDTTSCFSIVEQPIIVNSKPTVEVLKDFILCVDPGDTQAGFLLSSQDDVILNGQLDKVVRYFDSQVNAEIGAANEIDKNVPFDASDGTELFVRVENTDDASCFNENNIQSFILNVAEYSTTGNATSQLTDCGVLGIAEFDLQSIVNDITLNGTVSLKSIDFYEDPTDAGYVTSLPTNVAPPVANTARAITDTDNDPNTLLFTNNTPLSQQIFVRIENNSGCVTFQTFDLLVSETPIVGSISSLVRCDVNGDNTEDIDLTEIENLMTLDFSQMIREITDINEVSFNYFTTETGRDGFIADDSSIVDSISDPANFTVNQIGDTPIYLVITASSTCTFATQLTLELNALPVITSKTIEFCEDSLGSNQFTIDLDMLNDTFEFYTEADPDVVLNYYTDAIGTSPISTQYIKTNSVSAIYLQAVNTRTTCESNAIIEIPLIANSLPTIIAPAPTDAVTCDDDGINDGITVFALNTLDSVVLNGQNPVDFTVSYFDVDDVEMLTTSQVVNGELYTAVVTNNSSGCDNTIDFTFIVNQLPEIQALNSMIFCDDDEITTNTTIIDLTGVISEFVYETSKQAISGGVTFYSDVLRTTEITNPGIYSKIGDTDEVIYLNLLSINNCEYQTEFNIQVNPKPVINFDTTNPFVFCEDSLGSNQYTLDLESNIAAIVLDDPSLYAVTFHSDISATAANEINTPYTTGNTTIYIKVISATNCENIEPITIEVAALPVINPLALSLTTICDIDGANNGVILYDFNVLNAEVLGSQSDINFNISYHETQQEAENGIPFNLVEITSGTYYVKIENRTTLCFDIAPITMTINKLPEIDGEEIFFCENNAARTYTKDTGDSDDSYLWTFTNGRASENTSEISLSFADVGSIATLTVTNNSTGCSNHEDFVIGASPTPEILPVVTKNFDTDEVTIEVTEIGDYLFALTKTTAIPDASVAQESNMFANLLPGKYYAHVIDLNGCGDVVPMEVNFVDYFSYFTPNGSGPEETETWHIQAIDEIPDTVAYIYNRYGLLMYVVSNGSPGWDGTYNGSPVPSDDYWVLIELEGGETIKDHITLKR